MSYKELIKDLKTGGFKSLATKCVNHLEPVLSDSLFLKLKFYVCEGYWPNLSNPQSFNEKLQWLKLHDMHPEYGMFVDKASVKEFVANKVGEEYIIPTIGIFNTLEEIDWKALPRQFVLKSTCDSGGVVICKDRTLLDIPAAIDKLEKSARIDYSKYSKEYPYKYVTHRYIAEAYLEDESGYELKDYKFFCFDGVPRFVQLDFDRHTHHRRNIYDINWNLLDLQILFPKGHDRVFPKPQHFEEMIGVAEKLSAGFPHVRIDLYNVNGKVYFGEMTFFHGSGMEVFTPRMWDYEFGKFINLPKEK